MTQDAEPVSLVHVGNPSPCSVRAKSTLDPRDVVQGKGRTRGLIANRKYWGGLRSSERRGVCPSMEVDFRVDGGLGRIWESPPSDNDPLWGWEDAGQKPHPGLEMNRSQGHKVQAIEDKDEK